MSRSVAQRSVVTRSGTGLRIVVTHPARSTHIAMPAGCRYDDGGAQTTVSKPPKAG